MTETGRILIADDVESFLESTADLLRREGYTVDTAPDGIRAREMLEAAPYDLLVADIQMNGNFDLELIKEMPRIAEGVPVIIVTAYPSVKTAVDSIHLPVEAYLLKPFDEKDLLGQVGRAMLRSRTREAIRSARSQIEGWNRELEKMLEEAKQPRADARPLPADAFIGLTFQNIITSLSGLRHLTGALVRQEMKPPVDACRLFECPRLDEMTRAIVETVDDIWATRNSFKSVVLADRRKKLQNLLRKLGVGPYGKLPPVPEDSN
ncbi:MAG: response regulator [Candidatus Eisenbacteria bacterium]